MNPQEASPDLESMEKEILELRAKFDAFEYCSEEFWSVYDRLIALLIQGTQVAAKQGNDKKNTEFREMIDDIENRIPSGYAF